MGSSYDPPEPPRGRRSGPPPGDPPPRGRAQVPPDRRGTERGRGGPAPYSRGRAGLPRGERSDGPDHEPRRQPGVGRASVRPGREPVPPQDPFDPALEPVTGVAQVGGRHAARGLLPARLSVRRAMRLRGRLLATSFALLLVLMGTGVVGGSVFLDSVQLSGELDFPETTTVYYSDGVTRMAKLGTFTRYELPYERISLNVQKAIVASEDQSFWTNEGIDVGGVVRAGWNNFTGGHLQGGSTITQQYARLAYELGGVTYQRKLKEAVLAWKMAKSMSKKEILTAYLNAVPFGRNAYGIEAAARAFFGKSADNGAPPESQLTLAEAMALVAMVKQPYPDPNDPEGSPGYDPTVSEAAATNAHNRFEYVRQQLARTGSQPCTGWPTATDCTVSPDEIAALAYPENVVPYVPETNGMDGPEGLIVYQVLSELTHTPGSPFYGAKNWKFIEEGGYQIYTTINKGAQDEAVKAASRTATGTLMMNQRPNLQAALVAVEPGTGRVLAYYGGDEGTGNDYAGYYLGENDEPRGAGYHPPGSSFKVYTLAAALKAGISLRSYWDWNEHDMTGRVGNNRVQNTSNCGELPAGDPTPCSLLQSLISSVNVPFYQVTLTVGPDNVLAMARDAGITGMWTNERERVDLRPVTDMKTVVRDPFDIILGIGQYPITVLDHANGLATMASAGLRAEAHFVVTVRKNDQIIYGETLPDPNSERILSPTQVNDLTYAMSQVAAAKTSGIGWDTAGKTGTWEYGPDPRHNAHAWMVGFTRRIATAVWLGNHDDEAPLLNPNGGDIYGSNLPASIWRQFMLGATKAMNEPKVNTKFNAPNFLGNTMPSGAVPSPTPTRDHDGFPTIPGWPPGRD